MEMVDDVLIALRRIIRAMDLHSKYLVKTSGLTMAQLLLMQSVRDNEAMTIGKLAAQIHLSQATVTTILDRLEHRGLLVREGSIVDKRKVYVKLTDDGKELINNAPLPLKQDFLNNFCKLSQWEQTTMLSTLQRFAYMMDGASIESSHLLKLDDIDERNPAVLDVERLERSA